MLNSTQETLIDQLFSERFGAFHLFRPEKYRQGKTLKEPCDLFWTNGKHAALFYLNDSESTLAKQRDHNQRQQHRYIRLWHDGKRNRTDAFDLRGTNRFGDTCSLRFEDMEAILVVSVVSAPCSVIPEAIKDRGRPIGMITVSDALLMHVAACGGTFLDLLLLVTGTLAMRSPREGESALDGILKTSQLHLTASWAASIPQDGDKAVTAELWRQLSSHLHLYRLQSNGEHPPLPDAGLAFENNSRDALSKIFGDLYLRDYQIISHTAAVTFANAGHPTFPKWAVTNITCGNRNYTISVFPMGSADVGEVMKHVMKFDSPNTSVLGYMIIPGLPIIYHPQMITMARNGRYFIQSEKLFGELISQIRQTGQG